MDAFFSEPQIADLQWGQLEKRFFRDDYFEHNTQKGAKALYFW